MDAGRVTTAYLAEEFGSSFFKAEGCFHPRRIFNQTLGEWMMVPCQNCLYCLRFRQSQWVPRLVEELRQNPGTSYFVTMTYSPENIPVDERSGLMQVWKDHIKTFNADLRKRFQQGFFYFDQVLDIGRLREKISLPKDLHYKYYLTSEYGPDGGQPHYHSVFYNLPDNRYLVTLLFEEVWKKGFCRVYEASERTISYITKYLVNSKVCDTYDPLYQERPFSLMSKKLGISYVERMGEWHRSDPLHRQSAVYHGETSTMGRYWKEKIFSEEQRLILQRDYEKRRSFLDDKLSSLDNESTAIVNHAREKWQSDQEYAAEWLTLKKHKL